MTVRDRFVKVLNFEVPQDRMPMIEWAAWWNKTIERWKEEGLPEEATRDDALEFFGVDNLICIGAGGFSSETPKPVSHGAGIMTDEKSYEAIKPTLYTDEIIETLLTKASELKQRHEDGQIAIRLWLDGFFWYPRKLFGIMNHIYAFYDYPELMHRINSDLADFDIRVIKALFPVLKPDMVGFAEDMSYNHGPMLSKELYDEFIAPYYKKVVPYIKEHAVKVMVDSDGDVHTMIPWLLDAGIEGVYPLERQAGVDIAKIRKDFPKFLMMGGYDKMVMSKGEADMRAEFERILPVMKSGGYIPSVDHQTPPGVSLANYKIYVRLFKEYCEKAVK